METAKQSILQSNLFKQVNRTTQWNIFDFESVSSLITYHKFIIHIHSFLLYFLNPNVFSSLYEEYFETDEEILVELMS